MANTMKQESLGQATIVLDLVKQGLSVYLPLNGHDTPDLVAIKDGVTLRIEVKALSTFKDRSKSYPAQASKFEVLAQLDISTGQIRYIPEISVAYASVKTGTLTDQEKEMLSVLRRK